MDEVVGRVDAVYRLGQRGRVENVAPEDLRGFFDEGPQLVGRAGHAPQYDGLPFEQREQPPADVPGSARQQHDREIRHVSAFRLRRRHRFRFDLSWAACCFADSMLREAF